jgi:hypothetical protein
LAFLFALIEICDLLHLERPNYQIDATGDGLNEIQYRAAAYFPYDPYLARVGAIGQIDNMSGSKEVAKEACAAKVAQCLIQMVEDDNSWDDRDRKKEENLRAWNDRAAAANAFASSGFNS